ncbi:MAG: prepilin-type N-terminal cleavage/methylation domain-containing protein [Planctomycetes bacterium]|nr:prepilin-type N-terminal cleavage/methylation domain-containing protein [Planctomycetota bacterium]
MARKSENHDRTATALESHRDSRLRCHSGIRPLRNQSHNYGFSLIELLIVLSVASLLLGLLMPGLQRMRKAGWQVACASNEHQMGIAMSLYVDEYGEHMPYTWFAGTPAEEGGWGRKPEPGKMMTVYRGGQYSWWDGLGLLFAERYNKDPQAFYCPAHRGGHPYSRYETQWNVPDSHSIVGNYHYRGLSGELKPTHRYKGEYLRRRWPNMVLMTDGLQTKSDFSHQNGTNVLRIDLSVDWFRDANENIYNRLPDSGDENGDFGQVWALLDKKNGGR